MRSFHCHGAALHVRDADSRNGTFVNGQKADDVAWHGHTIKVGATESCSAIAAEPPTVAAPIINLEKTETLVRNVPMPRMTCQPFPRRRSATRSSTRSAAV